MRRAAALLAVLLPATALAAPPEVAPPPQLLLAQVDDSDLGEEESLDTLNQEEIDKEAWSMGAAIGLSLVPGGGFGLFYAERPAAGWLTTAIAAAGYGLGVTYMLGVFDTDTTTRCKYKPGNEKADESECLAAIDQTGPLRGTRDPRTNEYYFDEGEDFERVTTGDKFEGTTTGLIIIGSTYAVTTILGAVWSGSAVYQHNEELRKRVESTASVRPILGYTGREGVVGLGVDF